MCDLQTNLSSVTTEDLMSWKQVHGYNPHPGPRGNRAIGGFVRGSAEVIIHFPHPVPIRDGLREVVQYKALSVSG